jgi:hypothetical protein
MRIFKIIYKLFIFILLFSLSGLSALAFDPSVKINVYGNSDTELRSQIDVVGIRNTNYINFYIDQYA